MFKKAGQTKSERVFWGEQDGWHPQGESCKEWSSQPLTISVQEAEMPMVKAVQNSHFQEEINNLHHVPKCYLKRSSSLNKVNPFLDQNGIVRVSGHLKHSLVPENVKFPFIMPTRSHIASSLTIASLSARSVHVDIGLWKVPQQWLVASPSVSSAEKWEALQRRRGWRIFQQTGYYQCHPSHIEPWTT